MFGLQKGLKLPIYFFGEVSFPNLSGSCVINAPLRRGMIQFGCDDENILYTREPIRVYISGSLVFNGPARFAKAVQILVWNKGVLEIGDNAWVGSFTKIVSFRNIKIGSDFLCSWECQLFDTDFHFLMNTVTNSIQDNSRPILIGDKVWLGSRVSVLKGSFLSNRTVVASSSLCNTDYSSHGDSIILGGVPAKLIKKNMEYVTDRHLEKRLFTFFNISENANQIYVVKQSN
ncbi:MAG: hypothetical protein ACOVRK_02125 [Chryseobacterium taeanense]